MVKESKNMIRRVLKIKQCPSCQGGGKSNLAKARPTTCKRCHGTGIVKA